MSAQEITVERHFKPQELGELWNLDANTIRRMFENEDGVMIFGSEERRSCRRYKSMRIPQSIAAKVHRRLHERPQ
jgi:hypothetical protein